MELSQIQRSSNTHYGVSEDNDHQIRKPIALGTTYLGGAKDIGSERRARLNNFFAERGYRVVGYTEENRDNFIKEVVKAVDQYQYNAPLTREIFLQKADFLRNYNFKLIDDLTFRTIERNLSLRDILLLNTIANSDMPPVSPAEANSILAKYYGPVIPYSQDAKEEIRSVLQKRAEGSGWPPADIPETIKSGLELAEYLGNYNPTMIGDLMVGLGGKLSKEDNKRLSSILGLQISTPDLSNLPK